MGRVCAWALGFALLGWAAFASAAPRRAQVDARALEPARYAEVVRKAERLPRLHALLVARRGVICAEERFRGPPLDRPVNIKSVSKSIMSALVGIAIAESKLAGVEQPIAPFFARYRERFDPRIDRITIEDLLTMRSGLARTSGESYMRWVTSKNWVEHVLTEPMIAPPGESMIYSTGNTHLLSALLTEATGQSTLAYAREKLTGPLGIELPGWQRDPQGIYFGGNQMRLSPRALVRFGELYRNGGKPDGKQVVPATWVAQSLTPRTRSMFSGQLYGYGWFVAEQARHPMFYAWGYGGQFIFVIPDLEMTVVTISEPSGPRDLDHLSAVYELITEGLVDAAEHASITE